VPIRSNRPTSLALVALVAALGGACHPTPPRVRPSPPQFVLRPMPRPQLPPLLPYACKVPARLPTKALPRGPAVSGAPVTVSQQWSNSGLLPLTPSPDGALVGAVLPGPRVGGHSIVLADTTTGEVRASWPSEAGQAQLRFSRSGALVAAIGTTVVELWDTTTGARRATIAVDGFGFVAFSDDESRLTILGKARQVAIVDTASGAPLETITLPERLWNGFGAPYVGVGVGAGVPSPDGGLVAYPWGPRVVLFDVAARAICGELELEARVDLVAFAPDAGRLAISTSGSARVWDVATGGARATLRGSDARTRWPMWSPDGARLALVASDHVVVHTVDEPGAAGIELARGGFQWLPDSTGGLFPTSNGMAWTDLATKVTGGLALGVAATSDASFSVHAPDASSFVTRHPDGALRLWDAGATKLRALLEKDATQEEFEAFYTPDGAIVGYAAYRAGDDTSGGVLKLFSAKTGAVLGTLITGSADHGVPSFRADGLELAKPPAAGADAVALYGASPLAPAKAPWPSTFHPESVSFSPRGSTLLAIGTVGGESYRAPEGSPRFNLIAGTDSAA
jgi:WD40 repeat protein